MKNWRSIAFIVFFIAFLTNSNLATFSHKLKMFKFLHLACFSLFITSIALALNCWEEMAKEQQQNEPQTNAMATDFLANVFGHHQLNGPVPAHHKHCEEGENYCATFKCDNLEYKIQKGCAKFPEGSKPEDTCAVLKKACRMGGPDPGYYCRFCNDKDYCNDELMSDK